MNLQLFSRFIFFLTLPLAIVLLASCKPSADDDAAVPLVDPLISGDSVQFASDSPTLQHIVTAPAVTAQPRALELPGRLAWDDDHTSRVLPAVSGRFSEATLHGILGASVKAQDTLGILMSTDVGAAQSEYVSAHAVYVQTQKTAARAHELQGANGVAMKEVEQAETDLLHAKAEMERTQLRLKTLGVAEKVDQRFSLRSPISGVVVERHTNPGEEWDAAQPGDPLFVVSDPTYLWCWIDVPESELSSLHAGMKVHLHSSAWPQEKFEAEIDYVSDALDPASRTLRARARLRNVNRHLKSEMYVTVELEAAAQAALDVPGKAVFLNGKYQQVFVKTAKGVFTRKTVDVVSGNPQRVSIARGLNTGDDVVVDGALYLEKLLEDAHATGNTATSADRQPTSSAGS